MTQAISAQPGRTSGTVLTAIDVVRLSLVQLKGGSPQAPLPNGVARVAQNLTPPVFAGQGPVGQTPPVQQAAVQAAVPATAPAAALATTHATTQATTATNFLFMKKDDITMDMIDNCNLQMHLFLFVFMCCGILFRNP